MNNDVDLPQHKPELARYSYRRSPSVCASSRLCRHKSTDAKWALEIPTNKLRAKQHWRDASGTLRDEAGNLTVLASGVYLKP